MSPSRVALLGAVAGLTILLGLPVGRLSNPPPRLGAVLNSSAVGILVFLLWDVLGQGWAPVAEALGARQYGQAVGYGLVLGASAAVGSLGMVYFDRWVTRRRVEPSTPMPSGPHLDDAGTFGAAGPRAALPAVGPGQLAMLIAVGIGLHNFAEGLAIGSSAASGEIALALLLIVGFALHNATEGYGIVAPLVAAGVRPSWGSLGVLGLVGGGPTFVGTLIGQLFTNGYLSIAFLALAAGSILYVVIEMLAVGRRMAAKEITTWGLMVGLLLGFATDAIVTAAGV